MRSHKMASSLALVAAVMGLASLSTPPAMSQLQQTHGVIADNDSILIDGKTFNVIVGKAKRRFPPPRSEALGRARFGPRRSYIPFRRESLHRRCSTASARQRPFGSARCLHWCGGGGFLPNRIKIEHGAIKKNPEHQKHPRPAEGTSGA